MSYDNHNLFRFGHEHRRLCRVNEDGTGGREPGTEYQFQSRLTFDLRRRKHQRYSQRSIHLYVEPWQPGRRNSESLSCINDDLHSERNERTGLYKPAYSSVDRGA